MDEYGRIDVVEAGASVGGGLVVHAKNNGENWYLDIEAEKLFNALKTSVVSFIAVVEGNPEDNSNSNVGGTSIFFDSIVSAIRTEQLGYTFTASELGAFVADAGNEKPTKQS